MDSASMVKRAIDYQKATFDASYNTMVILQGQAEKMVADLCEQSNTPKESVKLFQTTISECKNRRDDLKKIVDDGFSNVESFFTA